MSAREVRERFVDDGPNSYLAAAFGKGGQIADLELVERVKFDAIPTDAERFAARGALRVGELNGVKYLEAGRMAEDRWAYRFILPDDDSPAAISEIRLYRIMSGKLPAAAITEPPANDDGWHRTFALYFEDVSVGYNFAVAGDGGDETSIGPMLDRLIATMKFTGQNMFCYPGAWYNGLMGTGYLPRSHLVDYRLASLDKFDKAGIGYMPTINQFHLPMSAEEIAAARVLTCAMRSGAERSTCGASYTSRRRSCPAHRIRTTSWTSGKTRSRPMTGRSQHPSRCAKRRRTISPYFCGVNFARQIKCPIVFGVGFIDTVCPPHAGYAAYNVCPSKDKAIFHGIGSGHSLSKKASDEMEAWIQKFR
ncbi:MAG TPA: acetylxylan esterase [Kiritimatiellia bacterium]|nr:acetylxylan esterase [Kiritimatiellia bacterium]